MMAFQHSRPAVVAVLALLFGFAGCTRNHQQARPVETAEQAAQMAARHLFSLGQDTSFYTVQVRPDHPIWWDTITTANRYTGWPVEDSSSLGKLVRDHLSGNVFWQCFSMNRVAPTDSAGLVTDATNAEVYLEAGTGVVLLTLPHDYYNSTDSSH